MIRDPSPEQHPYQALQQHEELPRIAAAKRKTPGFARQFVWCLTRAALQRSREPRAVFLSYAIIALTGALGTAGNRLFRGLHKMQNRRSCLGL